MTNNDSITAAARIEAARRDMDPGKHGENNRAWFVAGAEWQAAQEPTDAECLAVLNVAIVPLGEPPKRNGLADWNPAAVERVRAALSAARKA